MKEESIRKYVAEIIGTFALVFAGTGAIVVNELSQGSLGDVGIAMTFGLVIMVMIYALGDISGAHFNPAVSFGFWAAGRFPAKEMGIYAVCQLLGALLASALMRFTFLDHTLLGVTSPGAGISFVRATCFEAVLTFFLVFVILNVSHGAKEKGAFAGTAIGGTIALDCLFGGPITGASMNPARSLGPALIANYFHDIWIYILGPMIGAFGAAVACKVVRGKH
jgi:aquaporin Z